MSVKPNIIYIFADQLRYSAVACNGNRVVRTPHIDRLAREGATFDEAYASCPICSPYRGNILTGRYAHANGVMDNQYKVWDDQTTIARVLREHDYRTAYVGKLHLGHGPYTTDKRRLGFDDMIAYNCIHDYFDVAYHHNERGPFRIREYAPRGETQLLLDYIQGHSKTREDQPFCVFLSWGPPHWTKCDGHLDDYACYPREYDVYNPQTVDVPGNVPIPLREYAKREIADYYAMTTSLDDCMGRILKALDEWGLAENTIVCFSSDHGDHLNAHGIGKEHFTWLPSYLRMNKGTPYEESVHVPFILRYPKRVAGNRRTETLFNSVDVMPTLLSLCDIPIPAAVQGKDISHAALDTPGTEPDSVYLQILGPGWPNRAVQVGLWRGVRTRRYAYARWKDRDGLRMLFDRKKDPLEMTNLADDPAYAQIAGEMESLLQRWMRETDDPFDAGTRLPQTNMLDLGQQLIDEYSYSILPAEYRAAIEKYKPKEF
ncbi:MAG: sulfatase [Planctomycetes bacterium]|nr:sulfatase [Planctomycetota bacterium]